MEYIWPSGNRKPSWVQVKIFVTSQDVTWSHTLSLCAILLNVKYCYAPKAVNLTRRTGYCAVQELQGVAKYWLLQHYPFLHLVWFKHCIIGHFSIWLRVNEYTLYLHSTTRSCNFGIMLLQNFSRGFQADDIACNTMMVKLMSITRVIQTITD